jgi:hypothetical protein
LTGATQRCVEWRAIGSKRTALVSTKALGTAFATAVGAAAAFAPPAAAGCRNIARCSSRYWYAYETPDNGPTGPLHCQGLKNEAQNESGGTAVVQPLFHESGVYRTGQTTVRHYGAVAESSYSGWAWPRLHSAFVQPKAWNGKSTYGTLWGWDSWEAGYSGACGT